MKENKVVRFDRIKNKIVVNVTQEGEIKDGDRIIGYTNNRFDQEYKPEEMKTIYKNLNGQINNMEKALKEIKLRETTTILKFDYDELVKLKDMMGELKILDQMEKDKNQKSALEMNIKQLKKDAVQLKPVIIKLKK